MIYFYKLIFFDKNIQNTNINRIITGIIIGMFAFSAIPTYNQSRWGIPTAIILLFILIKERILTWKSFSN